LWNFDCHNFFISFMVQNAVSCSPLHQCVSSNISFPLSVFHIVHHLLPWGITSCNSRFRATFC
jgi:hypothetical protein